MGFLQAFWVYLVQSAPYLMLGLLLSGFVRQWLSMDFIKKNLGQNSFIAVLKSTLIGIPLPLCSCAVVPTAVTLKKSGASNGATSSFLIATPESGIDSIFMTYGLIGLPMALLRPIATFFSAVSAGLLQILFNPSEKGEVLESEGCCPRSSSSAASPARPSSPRSFGGGLYRALHYGFYELLRDLSVWLFIGLLLGAVIVYLVPEESFAGLSPNQGRLLILAFGIPFYICASATTPIAAALIMKGMSPGTALLLLLVGPATNISNLAILQKYIGTKGIVINVFSIAVMALAASFLADFLYDFFRWETVVHLTEDHLSSHSPLATGVTVLFCLLLANALKDEVRDWMGRKKLIR
ncbi:MAG: SO_0444 family Cu/Zn efflux transporter [Bacteriovoracales bacterium]|nr:SO_0444 family Cu/Zn efflux transporter [Bacteriovoracales bacterium]